MAHMPDTIAAENDVPLTVRISPDRERTSKSTPGATKSTSPKLENDVLRPFSHDEPTLIVVSRAAGQFTGPLSFPAAQTTVFPESNACWHARSNADGHESVRSNPAERLMMSASCSIAFMMPSETDSTVPTPPSSRTGMYINVAFLHRPAIPFPPARMLAMAVACPNTSAVRGWDACHLTPFMNGPGVPESRTAIRTPRPPPDFSERISAPILDT